MNISVIGCGRWGTFIGWYLAKIGNNVLLYGKKNAPDYIRLEQTRKNDLLELLPNIQMCDDINQTVNHSDIIVISINSQGLRNLMQELTKFDLCNKTIVLCMKGIEVDTGKRLTQIVEEYHKCKIAIWVGPGHVQDFVSGKPNCMVIDSKDKETVAFLIDNFSSQYIRFYYGEDLIGNEIGAATKNIIGIASGILDGLDLSSLKGVLTSRGTREVARLIEKMGGDKMSAYGLSHLGDYGATVFSPYSHNREFGENFVKGINYTKLAEGYYTVKAVMALSKKYNVEVPICKGVYDVLYNDIDAKEMLTKLFSRPLKNED